MSEPWAPGPWEMESRGWVDGSCLIRCGPDDRDGFLHHAQANARLIAAAPEMAELLERVADEHRECELPCAHAKARRLLSRIRGEET